MFRNVESIQDLKKLNNQQVANSPITNNNGIRHKLNQTGMTQQSMQKMSTESKGKSYSDCSILEMSLPYPIPPPHTHTHIAYYKIAYVKSEL